MKFCKMNGLGNDYIFIDTRLIPIALDATEVARLSDRHTGIGGDGVVLIDNSDIADARMIIYNADGSRAEMCGNALRCVAKYIADMHNLARGAMTIETDAGVKEVSACCNASQVTAGIGEGKITGKIPIECGNDVCDFYIVDVGNPHAITFEECFDIDAYGEYVSTHPKFFNRTNVEYIKVLARNCISVDVYERGAGRTLACGTGAAASAYLAMTLGAVDSSVVVELAGGKLLVELINNSLYITGDAKYNFYGEVDYNGKT